MRGLLVSCALLWTAACSIGHAFDTADLSLPPGYHIALYSDAVPNARQLAVSPAGVVYAGSMQLGQVYAVLDRDRDRIADEVVIIARDLHMPSGVAFRDGALYVAEIGRVLRFDDIEHHLHDPRPPALVTDALPRETHHGWKFIAFGPDGRLYVPVGAPCNVCEVEDPFGTILSMRADGSDSRVYARGIRNSVGFDWAPGSTTLWFSDNGRDRMGDDLPPGELNRAPAAGLHFGFPYIHGGNVVEPLFGIGLDPADFRAPAWRLDAHVAPLGIEFYRGSMFPGDSSATLFVAEHGSWNRSRKAGYRVMRARVASDGEVLDYEPFVTGWLQGQAHWGRPVDFATLDDGSLLISDDEGGRIYRVSYTNPVP